MVIKRISENDDRAGQFINEAFTDFAIKSNVDLNFEEYCFAAENDEGEIIGVITGRAYYNEVHIGDLIIDEKYRRLRLGSELVKKVEVMPSNTASSSSSLKKMRSSPMMYSVTVAYPQCPTHHAQ